MAKALPLQDIVLPPAIGWWPPALGWWLLVLLVPLLLYGLWRLIKQLRRKTAVKVARKLLRQIQQDKALTPGQKLAALSALLRRVAISTRQASAVAGLTGERWLHYLDQSLPGQPFSQGPGRYLAEAQYRRDLPDELDMAALFQLCDQWIKRQR